MNTSQNSNARIDAKTREKGDDLFITTYRLHILVNDILVTLNLLLRRSVYAIFLAVRFCHATINHENVKVWRIVSGKEIA